MYRLLLCMFFLVISQISCGFEKQTSHSPGGNDPELSAIHKAYLDTRELKQWFSRKNKLKPPKKSKQLAAALLGLDRALSKLEKELMLTIIIKQKLPRTQFFDEFRLYPSSKKEKRFARSLEKTPINQLFVRYLKQLSALKLGFIALKQSIDLARFENKKLSLWKRYKRNKKLKWLSESLNEIALEINLHLNKM